MVGYTKGFPHSPRYACTIGSASKTIQMDRVHKAVVNVAVFKITWQIQIIFSMTKAIGRKVSWCKFGLSYLKSTMLLHQTW